jgi:hypothetical protein
MKKHFFITGFPRSQTAWVANLLSTGDSFCFHDAFALDQVDKIPVRLEQPEVPIVGFADPVILLFWRSLVEWYPEAKWVVIERDLNSAFVASVRAFGPVSPEFFVMLEESLAQLIAHVKPLRVPFDRITPLVAQLIGDHVGVKVGPVERLKQLCQTNVQVHNLRARLALIKPPLAATS